MAKVKKLNKEELEKVTGLTNKANQIAMQLGSLVVQKSLLIEKFKENIVLINNNFYPDSGTYGKYLHQVACENT